MAMGIGSRHTPERLPGRPVAFCDFAGPGDESVVALCDGNRAEIVDAWRSKGTIHSVGYDLNDLWSRADTD